ncbi:MAG: accessory gene regulator B family protein [Bacilli bacterium]|nr:accessory gene regulator B family protein [Bacilli bacterium]
MKKVFLDTCLKLISQNNSLIDAVKLDEIRYGLEGIYLTLTKTIVIFALTVFLGIFKEMIIMLIVFNILRTTGFGIHAKKSWQCWISSITIFVIFPFLAKIIAIPIGIRATLGIIAVITMFLYAPADTVKHPLLNMKKRIIWKTLTVVNCIVLVVISLVLNDSTICNLLLFGIYSEVAVINPITYKIFKLPYNNYLNYDLSSNA